ncbi:hypothetical protein ACVIGB_000062 [Bradyrhizobium sp. USDA 4341]
MSAPVAQFNNSVDFKVTFADHPILGPIAPAFACNIGWQEGLKALDAENFVNVLETVINAARKDVASRYINYEATIAEAGDSAYLNRLDKLSEQFIPSAVDLVPESIGLPADTERVRYFMNGIHPDDGGSWSDWSSGIIPEEAVMHALWKMALNGKELPEDIELHVSNMIGSTIKNFQIERVKKDELASAARDLIAEIGASSGPAYDKVVEMLRLLEIDVSDLETTAAPRM